MDMIFSDLNECFKEPIRSAKKYIESACREAHINESQQQVRGGTFLRQYETHFHLHANGKTYLCFPGNVWATYVAYGSLNTDAHHC